MSSCYCIGQYPPVDSLAHHLKTVLMLSLPAALTERDRLGLEITGLFPVAREMDRLRIIELDCVMCRRPGCDADVQ